MNERTVARIKEMYDRIGYWVIARNNKGVYSPMVISHIAIILGSKREEINAVTTSGYEVAVTAHTQLFESYVDAQKAADALRIIKENENEKQYTNNLTQKRSVRS